MVRGYWYFGTAWRQDRAPLGAGMRPHLDRDGVGVRAGACLRDPVPSGEGAGQHQHQHHGTPPGGAFSEFSEPLNFFFWCQESRLPRCAGDIRHIKCVSPRRRCTAAARPEGASHFTCITWTRPGLGPDMRRVSHAVAVVPNSPRDALFYATPAAPMTRARIPSCAAHPHRHGGGWDAHALSAQDRPRRAEFGARL